MQWPPCFLPRIPQHLVLEWCGADPLQIAPKDDELKACQQFTGKPEDLSPPEQFLLTMSTVPRLHDKINVLILMAQFQACSLHLTSTREAQVHIASSILDYTPGPLCHSLGMAAAPTTLGVQRLSIFLSPEGCGCLVCISSGASVLNSKCCPTVARRRELLNPQSRAPLNFSHSLSRHRACWTRRRRRSSAWSAPAPRCCYYGSSMTQLHG